MQDSGRARWLISRLQELRVPVSLRVQGLLFAAPVRSRMILRGAPPIRDGIPDSAAGLWNPTSGHHAADSEAKQQ